ncbi:MafI family immunity protein [Paenibacillus sp. GCM10023252]|uniref:MafI family immunity protein n=1 Tax=Paenibacillus sp. GCM10023252 TaxID=3252649 RepID=UPI00361609C8
MDITKEILEIVNMTTELPQEDFDFILELLEHDEWGVAFETLCAAILEEGLPIAQETYTKLESLCHAMGMDKSDLLQIVPTQ